MQTNSLPPPQQQPAPENAEIINFPVLKNWILLVARAVRSRKRLVIGVTLLMTVLGTVIANVMPKTYRASCKLLVQRNAVLAMQGDASPDTAPTRAASELVTKRENVIALVKETNLLSEWMKNRPLLARAKDSVTKVFSKPPTEKQMTDALADFLTTKMQVWSEDATVNIQIDWRDPVLAYKLVDAAQRGFIEAKRVQEVASVAESVAILENHADAVRGQIDREVTEMQQLLERKKHEETNKARETPAPSGSASAGAPPPPPRAAAPAGPSPEAIEATERQQRRLVEVGTTIDTKVQMIRELEAGRLRRVADAQQQLAEKRSKFTESHPEVQLAEQNLAAAQADLPDVVRLKGEVEQLQNEQADLKKALGVAAALPSHRGGFGGLRSTNFEPGGGIGRDVIRIEQAGADDRDPEVSYARSKLQFAISDYQTLEDQIGKARIELDTAQAAFKHRYTMVNPPEIPKGPISPKIPLIIIASIVGGLVIGIVAAASMELHTGIMFEPWQIEHATSLPVLVTIQLGDGGKKTSPPS